MRKVSWPGGRRFAFTMVDDTDFATVENCGPVYGLLADLGFRTIKTVWPLAASKKRKSGGGTLADKDYREWVLGLRKQGFEIASHGVTDHTSDRQTTINGLDRFHTIFDADPRTYIWHQKQGEGLCWGSRRLDGSPRLVYRVLQAIRRAERGYSGDVASSPSFWGDVCQQRITYVRNYTFHDIHTLSQDPMMPYHDPRRPFVQFWFSASGASNVQSAVPLLSEANQDRLVSEGGACIA